MTTEMLRLIEQRKKAKRALLQLYLQGEVRMLCRWTDEDGREHSRFRYVYERR